MIIYPSFLIAKRGHGDLVALVVCLLHLVPGERTNKGFGKLFARLLDHFLDSIKLFIDFVT
jgi:hypothetical protein